MKKKKGLLGLLLFTVLLSGCVEIEPPIADFGFNVGKGEISLTVQFADLSHPGSSEIDSWYWDFGDGDISQKQNPEHTFFKPGFYTVTLEISTQVGQSIFERRNCIFAYLPANKKLVGLFFGPYLEDENPGTELREDILKARLEIIAPYTNSIFVYNLPLAAKLAKDIGLNVTYGAWIDRNEEANESAINNLINVGLAGHANLLVVGDEVLFRNDLSSDELIELIDQVKEAMQETVPKIPVTYSDNFSTLIKHPQVIDKCNKVAFKIHPYWEGQYIDDALYFIEDKLLQLRDVFPDKEVIIITGWPSSGDEINLAQASVENSCKFISQFQPWAWDNKIKYIVLEAFDEDLGGMKWGIWDKQGNLKPCMEEILLN